MPHHIPHIPVLVEHINIVYYIIYHIHLYLWNTLISYTISYTTYIHLSVRNINVVYHIKYHIYLYLWNTLI